MCGIAGMLDLYAGLPPAEDLVVRMTDSLAHRGPDDAGVLVDPPAVLGHRRLSIIDLSPGGHQPMATDDERFWLTYNGEIYNYIELARELRSRGRRLRTSSDSEVLLQAFAEWGVDALPRLNGMFAFAIWDRERQTLFCARDRFAVKPFYYTVADGRFRFASEIKALLLDPAVRRAPNDARLLEFLAWGIADHTAETMFEGVRQLPPGSYLAVSPGKDVGKPTTWYRPEAATLDERPAPELLRERLTDAVSLRLRSDVTVGTALSGGMDSTSVTAIASRLRRDQGGLPPDSFSALCVDPALDESRYVRSLVGVTGSRNHEVLPTEVDAAEELDSLLWQMDEPFHSASVYGQRRVMELARTNGVVVVLDGNGGDEALSGYHHIHYPALLYDLVRRGHLARAVSEIAWRRRLPGVPALTTQKEVAWVVAGYPRRPRRVPSWVAAGLEVPPMVRPGPSLRGHQLYGLGVSPLPAWNHHADRNSMTFSLETRNPFLDYRIVELGLALDARHLLRRGYTKWVVREAMQDLLPRDVLERPAKQGFRTDERHWLRSTLGEMVEETFRSSTLASERYFDPAGVLALLESHRRGANHALTLWRAFMVERWFNLFIDPRRLEPVPAPASTPRSARSAGAAVARVVRTASALSA